MRTLQYPVPECIKERCDQIKYLAGCTEKQCHIRKRDMACTVTRYKKHEFTLPFVVGSFGFLHREQTRLVAGPARMTTSDQRAQFRSEKSNLCTLARYRLHH